jgi:hypothetical protein
MLKPKQKGKYDWHAVLQAKEGSQLLGLLHEWKIRLEKETCKY